MNVENHSSSEYDTAESNDSEVSSGSDSEVNVQPEDRTGYKTRSDRVSKPPQRYGW